ncbi:unnamed protein product, partial [Closterium sp. NIES-54]
GAGLMASTLRSSARHFRAATAAAFATRSALPRTPCVAASLGSAASLLRVHQHPARPFALAPSSHASPSLQAPPAASDLLARSSFVSRTPSFSILARGAASFDRIACSGRSAPQTSQPSISTSSPPWSFDSAQKHRLSTLVALPGALTIGRVPSAASAPPSLRAAHGVVGAARAAGAGQARGVFVEVKNEGILWTA